MPNKQHLLQPNLQSNHIEVRLIIVRLCTELQDPENNFPKESKPKKLLTNNYLPFLFVQGWMFHYYKGCLQVFVLLLSIGGNIKTFHWKTWSGCWKRCSAGFEPLFGFSCSFRRVITFRLVSPRNFPCKSRLPHRLYMKGMDFSPRALTIIISKTFC